MWSFSHDGSDGSGEVFTFGYGGDDGRLRHGDMNKRDRPVEVGITRFRGGVVPSEGWVWTWGCGGNGKLGQKQERVVPKEVAGVEQGSSEGARLPCWHRACAHEYENQLLATYW